jgi:IS1 family transposase/transposase-like protein
MAFHVFVFLLLFCLILSLAWLCHLYVLHHDLACARVRAGHPVIHRLLKPRNPVDCPACRLASTASSGRGPAPGPVRPWSEVKSQRGAPKRIPTEGFACPNPKCPYFGITDAHIHALVGDGKHGCAEQIQTFRCQACRTTFTSRRNTALYRLKTPSHQVARVLAALAEGLDVSAAERVFGSRQATITTWLTRPGEHAQTLHKHFFSYLHFPHLQLDELRTRLRCAKQVLWLWLVIDPCTKLLPVLHLGPRTQNAAHTVIHSLRQLLTPGCLPLFTSDGLNLYFYALTAHFGHWFLGSRRGRSVRQWRVAAGLIYGQVKKSYRRRKLVRVTHIMRLGTEDALKASLQGLGLSGRLNTAFIERLNLTVRHGVAALARRTWATSQQSPQLLAHLEWWRAYYHFVRPHQSLALPLEMVDKSTSLSKPVSGRFLAMRPSRQVYSLQSKAPSKHFCGYLHSSLRDRLQSPLWLGGLSSGKLWQGAREHFAHRPSSSGSASCHGWRPLSVALSR